MRIRLLPDHNLAHAVSGLDEVDSPIKGDEAAFGRGNEGALGVVDGSGTADLNATLNYVDGDDGTALSRLLGYANGLATRDVYAGLCNTALFSSVTVKLGGAVKRSEVYSTNISTRVYGITVRRIEVKQVEILHHIGGAIAYEVGVGEEPTGTSIR